MDAEYGIRILLRGRWKDGADGQVIHGFPIARAELVFVVGGEADGSGRYFSCIGRREIVLPQMHGGAE